MKRTEDWGDNIQRVGRTIVRCQFGEQNCVVDLPDEAGLPGDMNGSQISEGTQLTDSRRLEQHLAVSKMSTLLAGELDLTG